MYWYKNLTHRTVAGETIPGVYFLAFIHNFTYHLTSIVAYKDAMVDCWGLVTFEEFKRKVQEGWVVTSIPEGATVGIHHGARFTVGTVSVRVQDELNGRPTAQARLIDAMKELRKRDTPQLREQLRRAYADLPAYYRKYVFGSRMEKHLGIQQMLSEDESGPTVIIRET